MIRKYVYTILAGCVMCSVQAQDMAMRQYFRPGDTVYMSVDHMPQLTLDKKGSTRMFWDFSGLLAPYVYEMYVRPINGSQREQTGASMALAGPDNVERYFVVEDESTSILAYRAQLDGQHQYLGLCDLPVPVRPKRLTLDRREDFACSCFFEVPEQWYDALGLPTPLAAEKVRVHIQLNMSLLHDEQGEMITPTGPYLAFRQRKDVASQTVVEYFIDGEWIEQPQTPEMELPVDLRSGTSYHYWSPLHPEPLASVYLENGETASTVFFRTNPENSRVISATPTQPDIFVYPNPSFGQVRFDMVNLPPGSYNLEIYSILGVLKKVETFVVSGDRTVTMDLTDLKKGTYIYRLVDQNMNALRSKRLVIITP